MKVWVAE